MWYVIQSATETSTPTEIISAHQTREEAIDSARQMFGGDWPSHVTTEPPSVTSARMRSLQSRGYDKAIRDGNYIS